MATARYLDAGETVIRLEYDDGQILCGPAERVLEECIGLGVTPGPYEPPPPREDAGALRKDQIRSLLEQGKTAEAVELMLGLL